MAWVRVLLALLLVHAATTGLVAGNFITPILDGMCKSVECGKGTCEASVKHAFGFVCTCSPGWSQFHIGDSFRFLPCIVPNCTINYSCFNGSKAPVPPPASPPKSVSLFDPCLYSYCGSGTCVKTSSFHHRCDCQEGFSNLLNVSSLPCYKNCALGADCVKMGITLSNSSSLTNSSSGARSPHSLLWLFSLVMVMCSVLWR